MGILTNFLKLLKPEPNDFVDVAKHISENYDKLDQNAKSNNETLTNLNNSKLDKGTYSGNASNLKAEIDGKVSKSGDTMTGVLTISGSKYPEVIFNNIELAAVGYSVDDKSAHLRAARGTGLKIYEDNTATLRADNLNTKNKEVVAAINELNSVKFNNTGGVSSGDIRIKTSRQPTFGLSVGENYKGGLYGENDAVIIYNSVGKNYIHLYDNGETTILSKNLKTRSKEVVTAINELKNRFNNPSILWENNSSDDVSEFVAAGLSKYRIIMMKYKLGKSTESTQVGSDIHTEIVYITDDNPYFHINGFGSSRVKYNINGDTLTCKFKNDTDFVLRRVYGLIEK